MKDRTFWTVAFGCGLFAMLLGAAVSLSGCGEDPVAPPTQDDNSVSQERRTTNLPDFDQPTFVFADAGVTECPEVPLCEPVASEPVVCEPCICDDTDRDSDSDTDSDSDSERGQ